MALDYLLMFGLGLAVAVVLTKMGQAVVNFVIPQVQYLTQ